MIYKIKLGTVNDACLFSAKCNEYEEDIDYSYNKYLVDGKSFLGVISVGLDHICTVNINTDDTSVREKFKRDITLWIVEGKKWKLD